MESFTPTIRRNLSPFRINIQMVSSMHYFVIDVKACDGAHFQGDQMSPYSWDYFDDFWRPIEKYSGQVPVTIISVEFSFICIRNCSSRALSMGFWRFLQQVQSLPCWIRWNLQCGGPIVFSRRGVQFPSFWNLCHDQTGQLLRGLAQRCWLKRALDLHWILIIFLKGVLKVGLNGFENLGVYLLPNLGHASIIHLFNVGFCNNSKISHDEGYFMKLIKFHACPSGL